MEKNLSGDIDTFIEYIFNTGIKPSNSICFSFDDTRNILELFKTLLEIFTKGCKILFSENGKTVDLKNLKKKDIELFQNYFLSFGIVFHYRLYNVYQVEKFLNSKITNKRSKIILKKNKKKLDDNYDNDICDDMLMDYKDVKSNNLIDYRYKIKIDNNFYILFFNLLD